MQDQLQFLDSLDSLELMMVASKILDKIEDDGIGDIESNNQNTAFCTLVGFLLRHKLINNPDLPSMSAVVDFSQDDREINGAEWEITLNKVEKKLLS
ncbi:MAG: hypothetical protein GW898_10715 [Thiomicrospira sp.]|nr:hypothetical protein [Thiomicrospira sp.]NCN66375.1 hypothetical protein [Thiomicrospira sp.]NCO14829.1 hypothetical protein [Thiomicrospira sp.]NCO82425.1 hypothetical protein [Thiomicrospira sp.]OIP95445.1 MAG: hypothetical protein AUK56_05240 [Thiomicrospira sp. CG2_30_44_34]